MDIIRGAGRVITRTADATTAAAGAVGGAAINGVIGGLQGTVSGIRTGVVNGSHSTPAAAVTLGAIGAAGLVEWPILLGIGGTALVVHQLASRSDGQAAVAPPRSASTASGGASPRKSAPRKSSQARKSTPRKTSAARRRSAGTSSS